MGQIIDFEERRRRHRGPAIAVTAPSIFFFDVACPLTYLAAERVERAFPHADWRPVDAPIVLEPVQRALSWERAEPRAAVLRMPLVWPDRAGRRDWGVRARRAAVFAASHGRATPFALAAGRLAYCGGFDLDDPGVIAEAAAAARLPVAECVEAAHDESLDSVLRAASRGLRVDGVTDLPLLCVGGRAFPGEHRLAEALAAGSAAAS